MQVALHVTNFEENKKYGKDWTEPFVASFLVFVWNESRGNKVWMVHRVSNKTAKANPIV
jgi:hypothetical protein